MPYALVIAAHGSQLNPGSAAPAFDHADRIRETVAFEEVRETVWKEEPTFREALRTVDAGEVYVVPLFVADGYHTQEDIPADMGLVDDYREGYEVPEAVDGHDIWYAGAVGTEPLMPDVVLERTAEAGADVQAAIEEVRDRTQTTVESADFSCGCPTHSV